MRQTPHPWFTVYTEKSLNYQARELAIIYFPPNFTHFPFPPAAAGPFPSPVAIWICEANLELFALF
jgi:hypothetical protein